MSAREALRLGTPMPPDRMARGRLPASACWRALPCLLLACTPEPGAGSATSFPFEAECADEEGQPVPGVRLLARNREFATSGPDGLARGALRGRDGDRVQVSASAPDGLRVAGEAGRTVALQVVAPLGGGPARPQSIRLRFAIAPTERRYVLLVHAGVAGLPVRVRDRLVATTNDAGVAQAVLGAPPGDELQVTLDTAAQPGLRPANPTRVFVAPDRDDAFVFRQAFEASRAKTGRAPRGPRRL